jgi:hypothetical protein
MAKMVAMITFTVDPRATKTDIRDFIKDTLESFGGAKHSEDPLFDSLGHVSVGVLQKFVPGREEPKDD